jgi:RNA polymerase sigma-70 factor (ECF subfamily)
MVDQKNQDERYRAAVENHGAELARLARGYEADADLRRDLLQDVHAGLWRSLAGFRGQCSLRTWTYRVAHNIASDHVARQKGQRRLSRLEDLDGVPAADDPERETGDRQALDILSRLIRRLKQPDQQVILLYLEDMDAAEIAEITGLSTAAVATKIHRIKSLLARQFQTGER